MQITKTLLTGALLLGSAFTFAANTSPALSAGQANNEFGFNLYKAVRAGRASGQNTLVSPTSAYFALSMVANGANGQTEQAILNSLGAGSLTRDELNAANQALLKSLNSESDAKIALANSLWIRQGRGVLPSFSQTVKNFYDGEVQELDVSKISAADTINHWVNAKTNGKIDKLVAAPLQSNFYVINATYFKGAWTRPFQTGSTHARSFHLENGQTTQASMMQTFFESAPYADEGEYEAVELGYGKTLQAGLVVILPRRTLAQTEAVLDAKAWDKLTQDLDQSGRVSVNLTLPKFKFSDSLDLVQPLKDVGMGIAFTQFADFSELTRVPVQIQSAIQKTYLSVDEGGTEAAAATAIGVGEAAIEIGKEVTIKVDHPFMVGIRDLDTGSILFLGSVADPSAQ